MRHFFDLLSAYFLNEMDAAIIEVDSLMKRIDSFESNFKKCSKANRTKGYLKGRIEGLESLWKNVCKVDEKIEQLKSEENKNDSYFEDDQFAVLEERYYRIKGEIKDQLDAVEPAIQRNQQNNDGKNNDQQNEQSKVKLPKISLPTFAGSYHTWLSFKNRFTNLIHNSNRLSNVEKLEYLKSCLTPGSEAERTIQRYQITDQNYKAAWDRMNEKYDNRRILQDTQIETIIDRKEMKIETAKEIRELLDVIQESLEALNNLEVETQSWDPILVVLIKRKLPFKTREEWEKQLNPEDVPTYAQLLAFLEKRYRTVENLELVGSVTSEISDGIKVSYRNKSKSSQLPDNYTNCVACNNAAHSLMICETFLNMSISNRSAFVNAKKLCRNCLAVGHVIKDCKSVKRCFKCSRNHHTLLHRDDFSQSSSQEPSYERKNFLTTNQSNTKYQPFNYQRNHQSNSSTNHYQNSRYHGRDQNNFSQTTTQNSQQNSQMQHNQQQNSSQQNGLGNSHVKRNLTTITEIESSQSTNHEKETLFPTAIIKVKSEGGVTYHLRALLDQCSEEVFIKESVAKMLGRKQFQIPSFDVTGLEGVVTSRVEKATQVQMLIEEKSLEMNANIVTTLVGMLPKAIVQWPKNLFKNIKLADTNFANPNNVDIMLGTQAYTEILLNGVLKEGGYLAQNTKLGWIISGKSDIEPNNSNPRRTLLCLNTRKAEEPDETLKKFWEIEEVPRKKKKFTTEEIECEKVFNESYRRLADGRPQVKLPFKENPFEVLGQSRNQAVARWLSMERKLEKDKQLKVDYMAAIQEHLDLGHMERIKTTEKQLTHVKEDGNLTFSCYYIPHHAVVKEESKTTKTRIVFDASATTSSGKSLNEILMVGPTIQESLTIRLMKWRIHRYALRGDITKMYRQVKVYEEDVDFQRMVFRFNKTDPIEDFCLNTLTFGTASAAYMATRTLQQIAIDGEREFPIGSKIVKTDFHVDDLLTGADTIDEVKTIWKEIKELLAKAKFPMRKWSSNNNEVLKLIPSEEREFKSAEISIEDTLKTLGIGWSPVEDYFFFTAPEFNVTEKLTKRNFLSQAAKLFDPLGWLGPTIIKPKIMFQNMWKEELRWDDVISKELANEWMEFRNELKSLERIKIPRWFGWTNGCIVELHGFCDASKRAYGAVIYMKTTNGIGNCKVELILAKSRVAPVQTVRLPRLELCGAALLSDLMATTKKELGVETAYCWTDSSITIDWINSSADKYKTFVANRIAEIQECTKPEQWRHVDGKQNPADCLSRGVSPKELVSHNLWWNGPSWLKLQKENWPKNPNVKIPEDQIELKGKRVLSTSKAQVNDVIQELWKRYQSFKMLVRVSARVRSLKNEVKQRNLTVKEIESERLFWIRIAQVETFREEINLLKCGKPINLESTLLQLNPFLDSEGILRIGGRLKEALVDYDIKHPIIIPKNSILSKLIINDAHNITKHGGTQLTMTYTRSQYWIINTRKSVRNQITKCVKCYRYSQKLQTQLMGTLPEPRVNMTRAFLHTGIDYAGPVKVLTRRKPGKREVTKGWIALFVCLCTKAIHLEVVSSLSSREFLASFTRFHGRRGLPSDMYSDNSKTFIGANNELNEDLRIIKEELEPNLADVILKNNVQWHFIPPHAPHWGGIWEAGVKSMKHHVRRVIGESIHTFEEITTMLVEIEAVLNSRPLCPVTNDPNDLSILTPGHFLIGDALLSPPRPSLLEIHPNRLGIYKQISQRVEHFAKRWKKEYLSTLQHRRKWMRQCKNVEVGDLVIIKDDDHPPSQWNLGRVTEVFPDSEGLVRSVMVRTKNSELMRPIHKISILPIDKPIVESPTNNLSS